MPKIPVILVGGFLGAGKTTLIQAATEKLAAQGKRVGVVTNDQAENLVDTATLARPGLPIQEVSGGCFCCHFDDLVWAMDRLVEADMPDVLIGEPVGSCTDLSATVLQPMKQLLADRYETTPFSVLVDATHFKDALGKDDQHRFPENVIYIYRKQLEEADVIVLNKDDVLLSCELAQLEDSLRREFSQAMVMTISALKGTGVDVWLHHVLSASGAGRTITDVDYDVYADGEAALGWLNAAVQLQGKQDTDWKGLCQNFMQAMQREFREAAAEIAHLKLHLTAGGSTVTANLTGNREEPSIRGAINGSLGEARLLLNVRANIDPARLRSITEQCLQRVTGEAIRLVWDEIRSFAPARPEPTHRFEKVV